MCFCFAVFGDDGCLTLMFGYGLIGYVKLGSVFVLPFLLTTGV